MQRVFGAVPSLFRSSGGTAVHNLSFFSAAVPARSLATAAVVTTTVTIPCSSGATALLPHRNSSSNRHNIINNNNIHKRNMATKDHQKPISAEATLALIRNRRTYYALNKELPVPAARVEEIVKEALAHVPSSFNSQTNRVLALFGTDHDRLWGNIVTDVLKVVVPAEKWDATAARMAMFKAAGATILFFIDNSGVRGMQERFAGSGFESKFPGWAAESAAMLQFTSWVALEAEGLGANLQHYNPLVDDKVRAEWGLPADWELTALLVVGGRAGEPGAKDFRPVEDMYRSHGV